jgi:hypothetical protein
VVISFTKYAIKKEENMIIYWIYKSNHLVTPKEVVKVVDLGYLGVEKDFPDQLLSALPYRKKKNQDLSQKEKEKTEFTLTKRE